MSKNSEAENEKKSKTPKKPDSRAMSLVKTVLPAIVLYIVMRTMLVQTFRIPSGSMENTLQIGDFLFANKMLYGAEVPVIGLRFPAIREPRTDDLVVFDSVEEPGLKIVKRVVGSAGDTIRMEDAVLYRNGQAVDEPWAVQSEEIDTAMPQMRGWQLPRVLLPDEEKSSYIPSVKNWGPLEVPADSFFVMGDNRDNSYDSRYWGFLGRDRIEAHPMMIYYSYDRDGVLPLPALTSIRWSRIASRPK